MRQPYVGEGAEGARASAQIDREEAHTLDGDDPRHAELLASAIEWEDQAAAIESPLPALAHGPQHVIDAELWEYEAADPSVGIFGEGWVHCCTDDPEAAEEWTVATWRLDDWQVFVVVRLVCPLCDAEATDTTVDLDPNLEVMEKDAPGITSADWLADAAFGPLVTPEP